MNSTDRENLALRWEAVRSRQQSEEWRNKYAALRSEHEPLRELVNRMGNDVVAFVCTIGLPSLKLFQGIWEVGTVSGGAAKAGIPESTARDMITKWATGNEYERAMWRYVQWLHERGPTSRLPMPFLSWLRPKTNPPTTGWQKGETAIPKSGATATETADY
jgi:hypothetical protein